MKTLTAIITLALAGVLVGGCSKSSCDLAKTPDEITIITPKEYWEKVSCFNSGYDNLNILPENWVEVKYDTDDDGLVDLAFMATNDSKPEPYCNTYWALQSSRLSPTAHQEYKRAWETYDSVAFEEDNRNITRLVEELPYPVTLRKKYSCGYP